MTTIKHIPQNQRQLQKELIQDVANAVYNTPEQQACLDQFVPIMGRAGSMEILFGFFMRGPKHFWVVCENGSPVGFYMNIEGSIGKDQHGNTIGVGINCKFGNKGIMTRAFRLIERQHGPGSEYPLQYPLWAYTSQRNLASHKLLEKCGFERTTEEIDFHGEPSFEYVKREWTNWDEVE